MSILLWLLLFCIVTAVCAWIVLGDGAETVVGLVLAILVGADYDVSPLVIRVLVGICWGLLVIWFAWGLVDPTVRPWLLI